MQLRSLRGQLHTPLKKKKNRQTTNKRLKKTNSKSQISRKVSHKSFQIASERIKHNLSIFCDSHDSHKIYIAHCGYRIYIPGTIVKLVIMTKPCVVPKCKTGYKSEKSKRSLFRVPRDNERLKQWEEAIPGNVKLQETHVVCDKHFEDQYILREWIKHDGNGKIIAKAPYKHPQLSKLAIPTIFNVDTDVKRAVDSLQGYANVPNLASSINTSVGSVEPSFVDHWVPSSSSIGNSETTNSESLDFGNGELLSQIQVTDNKFIDIVDSSPVFHVPPTEESLDTKDILNNRLSVAPAVEIFLPIKVEDSGAPPSRIANKPYSVLSTVTISEQIEISNESTEACQQYSATIPSSWSVCELRAEQGQRILFSYAVRKIDNGIHVPVTQKCVVLDTDRKLEYFVYGHRVEIQEIKLARALKDAASLSKTLEAFQWIGICNGLGIDKIVAPIENAFLDYVQQWRHIRCTLISNRKRCDRCVSLRKHVNQQIRRIKTRPTLKRIHRKASNPFDQRKVSALLEKNARERCKKLQAQGKINFLMKALQEQKDKIARIEDATREKSDPN